MIPQSVNNSKSNFGDTELNDQSEIPSESISSMTETSPEKASKSSKKSRPMHNSSFSKAKGRKNKEIMQLLINFYPMYEGHWDEKKFGSLIMKTGFSKA